MIYGDRLALPDLALELLYRIYPFFVLPGLLPYYGVSTDGFHVVYHLLQFKGVRFSLVIMAGFRAFVQDIYDVSFGRIIAQSEYIFSCRQIIVWRCCF